MNEKYKYLAKNIILFLIANFIPKTLTFFMVPLYTRYLSTAEYGISDVLSNTIQLLLPILTLQIQDAVLRYTIERKDKQPLSVGISIALRGGVLLFSIIAIVYNFNLLNWGKSYYAYILLNYFLGSTNSVLSYYCRGVDKVKELTVASILMTVSTIILNVLFLTCFKMGLKGFLLANTSGLLINVLYIILKTKTYIGIELKKQDLALRHDMIKLSIPMVFSALSWWVNNASDRYILSMYCGVSVVGIYAVSSKIPSIMATFGTVIARAYSISAIKEFDYKDNDGFLGKSYSVISIGMSLICSVLLICNMFLAHLLFSGEFYEAWKYVPLLLYSVLMNQLSQSCENIFLALKETKIISTTAIIGALINTLLNFLLIPRYNSYGAAVATATGFFGVWMLRYIILKKRVNIKNNIRREAITYIILLLQVFMAIHGNKYIFLELLCVIVICILNKSEIIVMVSKLRR